MGIGIFMNVPFVLWKVRFIWCRRWKISRLLAAMRWLYILETLGLKFLKQCFQSISTDRRCLFSAVWGRDSADTLKVVANTVSNLRRKLGGSHTYIRTVRGGYVFSAVSATA